MNTTLKANKMINIFNIGPTDMERWMDWICWLYNFQSIKTLVFCVRKQTSWFLNSLLDQIAFFIVFCCSPISPIWQWQIFAIIIIEFGWCHSYSLSYTNLQKGSRVFETIWLWIEENQKLIPKKQNIFHLVSNKCKPCQKNNNKLNQNNHVFVYQHFKWCAKIEELISN